MSESKFSGLFNARNSPNEEPAHEADTEEAQEEVAATGSQSTPGATTQRVPTRRSNAKSTAHKGTRANTPAETSSPQKRAPGRPPGKRSNPDYEQATVYIRRDTHRAVKVALLQEGNNRQFSELVEDLLQQWAQS